VIICLFRIKASHFIQKLICLAIIFICFSFEKVVPGIIGQTNEPVKIGLLIQDKVAIAAKQGAELAIRMANNKGGLNGRPFHLITKDMEGPWGTGSKQAVDLIWEDEVWALLGSHDGRNAHLVEQAATKSIVVFLSAWSSDPTLSQAFVPWFFNCIPNDRQQAESLIEEIYNKRKITRIAAITDKTYDSNQALKNFLLNSKLAGKTNPMQFQYEDFSSDLNKLASKISSSGIKGTVLFCSPSVSLNLIRLFRQQKINMPVFGALSILNENELSESGYDEIRNVLSVPYGKWSVEKNHAFVSEYMKQYGKKPGLVASYAFDAANVLITALKVAGSPDREKIQEALNKMHYEGITGLIQFDEKGNRKGLPVVSLDRNN
jgi:branched-chain amino acid transport system substrate-binding protein